MKNIRYDIKKTSKYLTEKQRDFDRVTSTTRDVIRNAAQGITMLHNNDKRGAIKRIGSAYALVKKLKKFDAQFEYYTRQAYQEYAEAKILLEIKTHNLVPPNSKIGVSPEAYLLGLMDVVGELKRGILEELRASNAKTAETYFNIMRHIYDSTRSLRFAEAVLNGFRRKQDTARIQIENAGSEILSFKNRTK